MTYRLHAANGTVVGTSEHPIVAEGAQYRSRGLVWLDPTPGDGSYTSHVRDLDAERAAIWEAIKAERDRRAQEGGYLAAGKWFHSDTFSRTQQLGLLMMGPSVPDGLQWKTMDGTFVPMTPTLAGQIFTAAATQDAAMFAHAEALRAAVNAAEDPEAVDITAGWPATFSG